MEFEPQQPVVAVTRFARYIARVSILTRQEQLVLSIVLGLLLMGLAVKTYRTAHPPAELSQRIAP